jgi:hypothetical protein
MEQRQRDSASNQAKAKRRKAASAEHETDQLPLLGDINDEPSPFLAPVPEKSENPT